MTRDAFARCLERLWWLHSVGIRREHHRSGLHRTVSRASARIASAPLWGQPELTAGGRTASASSTMPNWFTTDVPGASAPLAGFPKQSTRIDATGAGRVAGSIVACRRAEMRDPAERSGHGRGIAASHAADRHDCWRHRSDVLSCESAGLLVLLSLRTGRYHTLEEPAGTIWRLLETGRSPGEIVDALSQRFPSAGRETIEADVRGLLADLSRRRLIEPAVHQDAKHNPQRDLLQPTVQAPRLQPPSTLSCIGRLAVVHMLLRALGLRAVLRMIGRAATCDGAPASSQFVDLLAHRVASAGVFYPFGAACLEHSVCLLWVARRCGIDVDFRVGVQAFPFSAHAWIEHRGRVVNDTPEQVALFTAFEPIQVAEL